MITTIIILSLAFAWLGYETDWMRVRLPVGDKKRIAQYVVCQSLKSKTRTTYLRTGTNDGNEPHDWSEITHYQVFISPGINDVLCGWDWLDKHCADMIDYQPKVEMAIGNVRYNMTIKQPSVIKDIMRVNKLTRKQLASRSH